MKLLISDWDGTLLNSLPVYYGAVVKIFQDFGVEPPTLNDYRDNITPDFMQFYWNRGIPHHATGMDLNLIRSAYFEENWNSVALHPGAKELFLYARGIGFEIFLATAETYEIGNRRLREFGVRDLIRGWARGGNARYHDIADILAFYGGEQPEKVWYIDDTASGLEAAKSNDPTMHTIGFTQGFNSPAMIRAAKPDHISDSLFEIPHILSRSYHRALSHF
jgi:phosphoglycolate phosphatase-like HAD superfamily hydrolase